MESVGTTVLPYRHWVLTVNLIFSSTPAEKRFQKLIEITLLLRDKQNPCPSKIMLWYYEVLNVSYRTPKPRRQCAVSRSTQGKLKKQKQGSFQCNLFLLNTLTCNIDCIFFPTNCEPPHYLHKPVWKGKWHSWSQMCWWCCHCHWGTRLDRVVLRQHLNLWIWPNHHWFLLFFSRLYRATRADVLSRSNFWVATRFITH